MLRDRYEYTTERLALYYEFISEGPNGQIRKMVEYTPTLIENVYNLAFGDYDEGSTPVRTRLYRMGLTNNLTEISKDFYVYGLRDKLWEQFLVGEDYEAFFVTRKNPNFDL